MHFWEQVPGLQLKGNSLDPSNSPSNVPQRNVEGEHSYQSCLFTQKIEDSAAR